MLSGLKKLNKTDKIWFSLFIVLAILVVGAAITHKTPNQTTANQTQNFSSADNNYEDTSNPPPSSQQTTTNTPTSVAENTNSSCHLVSGDLPDPSCTPGSSDPSVTQGNIQQTICVSGYTKTVRPSSSYTTSLKIQQIQQYGYMDTNKSDYEEDHLISLELGGSPSDPKNLWPEPGASPNPKDAVENKLHSLVCTGAMSLLDAQTRIASNWATAISGY